MRLSKRIEKIDPSSTLAITARAKQLKKEGKDVVDFGAGEPDFDTPEFIKDAAIKAIKEGFTKYTPSTGIPELKEAISKKFKIDNSLDYKASQIIVSCGAKHSLYNIFQALLDEGDEVLVPSPYWVSYPEMVKLAGGVPVFVGTDMKSSFKITKKLLKSKVTPKTKAFILNSPSNPTGTVYTKEELEDIASLLKEKSITVISDEIYENLIYEGKHVSIASLDKDIYNLAITVNGVSKTYSMTGWRIGYLAGPEGIIKAISTLQDHSTSNPTSISQKAALAALVDERGNVFVANMFKEFKKRRDYMVERLKNIPGFSPFIPGGAFYIFCSISKTGLKSSELTKILLEKELVAVIPGDGFGADDYIRLSFATSMEDIKKGLDRIEEWARSR